jgi:hypothetical protein
MAWKTHGSLDYLFWLKWLFDQVPCRTSSQKGQINKKVHEDGHGLIK